MRARCNFSTFWSLNELFYKKSNICQQPELKDFNAYDVYMLLSKDKTMCT
jgi:hypothetical protein